MVTNRQESNINQFLELVRGGLWQDYSPKALAHGTPVDWEAIYRLAEEQSVIGLIAAGIEKNGIDVPQAIKLQFVGATLQVEQRNKEMNEFVMKLFSLLRKKDIYALLVKGQGIAQCYERPLWRTCGDVDLLLSNDNYKKAKKVLLPLATEVEPEFTHFKHLGMTIDGFVVELHGTLHSRLSMRIDNKLDEVQDEVFYGGSVRSVELNYNENVNEKSLSKSVQVFLPGPNQDVLFVFTHILHHFFLEGVGLRQICDWCRLLWTYREEIDVTLLEKRLKQMGLMTEWKAFASLAVNYLGMPIDAMPLFNENDNQNKILKRKADRIMRFVMEVGNFGHKTIRSFEGQAYIVRKFYSFWGRWRDMLRHFAIFPKDSIVFFGGVLRSGLHAAVRGE